MSLRLKALIAAVALVALLTGALVWRAGDSYEQSERRRIAAQLGADARNLNDVLRAQARLLGATLNSAAQSSELVRLIRREDLDLAHNFATFTREWAQAAGADVTLAALDSLTAQDRQAEILHSTDLLAVVGMHVRRDVALDEPARARVATDAALSRALGAAWARAEEDPRGPPAAEVLAIDGRVYLCVIAPLYDSLQEYSVAGVAAALVELNSGWLRANFQVSGGNEDTVIYKVVYAGDAPTAATLEGAGPEVFAAAAAPGQVFEFSLRDSTERLLGLRTPFEQQPPGQHAGFIAFKSLDRELAPLALLRAEIGGLGLALAVVASALAYLGAYSVIRRIRRIQDATVQVRAGRFDTRVPQQARDELGALAKAFNDMTAGLKALGLYTHDTLARGVLDNPESLGLPAARVEGSVFFSDIRGFTGIAERMGAEELTAQLNEYFAAMGTALRETRGYVDKFIGDGIMAFWGRPFIDEPDYALRACRAALACTRLGAELRERWQRQGRPEFLERIGIATGTVVAGNIGTETKKNFTVIGDSVNLASRLEGANKIYGTRVLVDERTAELVRGQIGLREIDLLRVVGRHEPVRVFEPVPDAADHAPWHAALGLYRARRFIEAADALAALPSDGPVTRLLTLCRALAAAPPGADWQPVTDATGK